MSWFHIGGGPRVGGVVPKVGVAPRVLQVVPRVPGVAPRVLGMVPRVLSVPGAQGVPGRMRSTPQPEHDARDGVLERELEKVLGPHLGVFQTLDGVRPWERERGNRTGHGAPGGLAPGNQQPPPPPPPPPVRVGQ